MRKTVYIILFCASAVMLVVSLWQYVAGKSQYMLMVAFSMAISLYVIVRDYKKDKTKDQ